MRNVEFKMGWKGYGKGVKASFPEHAAAALIKAGYCVYCEEPVQSVKTAAVTNPLGRLMKKGK